MATESSSSEGYNDQSRALQALTSVLGSLAPLDDSDKRRVISSVLAFLNLGHLDNATSYKQSHSHAHGPHLSAISQEPTAHFSVNRSLTPKQFMMEKQPKTDVERIACLAYYLTHYRDLPHFKTLDLTKLNTEAAQPKFTNPTRAAGNALDYGYLAPATKGNRQLSAGGEVFVQALPDREAAKGAMTSIRPRSRKGANKRRAEPTEQDSVDSED